ncbi:hypothetical protein [uncultured Tateyamaria sp.]|uniref:hypothetical protein n=1 Tax=Tateyamaria sp. 1078 TaxID=3417464 RepID=UPI002615F760|nr:hypothetical protein [uncultured Tateyamaria sp.]
MSDPFVIWTMRRTGGTTFTSLLTTLSEHPGTQHEPFNPDRKFGQITRDWTDHKDPTRLMDGLDKALADRPLIKHCYELVPEMVNMALIKAASARGYRHIVLDRGAEVDRIISLELAKVTGAWGAQEATGIYTEIAQGHRTLEPVDIDQACNHMTACAALRRWLASQFDAALHTPLLVYFEEIYGDFETGRRTIEEVLACLGIVPDDHPQYEALLIEALTEKAQNSQSIAGAVPNMDALRTRLEQVYASEGFRFEQATRSHVPAPAVTPAPTQDTAPQSGLIIDVGAGMGDDAAFYLAKGFSVLAVPHDVEEAAAIKLRLSDEITAGRLLVTQTDLSPTGSPRPLIDEATAKYGLPHYVKVEAPGGERDLVTGITGDHGLPANLSFQVNGDWEHILLHMAELGYQKFQIVRQGAKHLDPPPHPAREGRHVPMRFTAAMSGCFGRELAPENWMDLDAFVQHVVVVQTRREEARALGQKPGWHDIHCRLQS